MPVGDFVPARAVAILEDAAAGVIHDVPFRAGAVVEIVESGHLRRTKRPAVDTDIVDIAVEIVATAQLFRSDIAAGLVVDMEVGGVARLPGASDPPSSTPLLPNTQQLKEGTNRKGPPLRAISNSGSNSFSAKESHTVEAGPSQGSSVYSSTGHLKKGNITYVQTS